jgi:hypothetical protein
VVEELAKELVIKIQQPSEAGVQVVEDMLQQTMQSVVGVDVVVEVVELTGVVVQAADLVAAVAAAVVANTWELLAELV